MEDVVGPKGAVSIVAGSFGADETANLSESMGAAVNSLRIVLAAEQSIQEERAITLD